jgi:hypothetical protein
MAERHESGGIPVGKVHTSQDAVATGAEVARVRIILKQKIAEEGCRGYEYEDILMIPRA